MIYDALLETWRSTRLVVPGSPFEGYIDEECAVPWMSFAMPVSMPESPDQAQTAIGELRRVFRDYDRKLRFELFDILWPDLPDMLIEAGFKVEGKEPIMVCRPADYIDIPSTDLQLEFFDSGATLERVTDFVVAQRRAYGFEGGAVGAGEEALSLHKDMQQGRVVAVAAVEDGDIVGTAGFVGIGNVVELAGVSSVPERRRRGIATKVAALALRSAMGGELASERGGQRGDLLNDQTNSSKMDARLVWLTAGSAEAAGIYRRLGFKDTGVFQINLTDKDPGNS